MHTILILPLGYIKKGLGVNLLESTALGTVKHISGFNLHLNEKFSLQAWLTQITASTSLNTNLRTLFK
jgi:hypothetical protein